MYDVKEMQQTDTDLEKESNSLQVKCQLQLKTTIDEIKECTLIFPRKIRQKGKEKEEERQGRRKKKQSLRNL